MYNQKLSGLITTFAGIIFILIFSSSQLLATTNETINPGSYIINMGSSPQTFANGLKPYGLVYQLIVTKNVPVRWAINESKIRDGIDFTVDNFDYKGSAFIIPVEFVNSDVVALINTWKAKGVDVNGPTTNSFVAPVYRELTSWPRAVLDAQNGDKVEDYYDNAEIPTASYITAGNPTNLTSCGDVYVLPHADPHNWNQSWQTALINFVTEDQGYLWAACHAVSSLEGMVTGANFLSEVGLNDWEHHNNGSGSYTYSPSYTSDPIMQFIGDIDGATTRGSEQIYMPNKGDNWRGSTNIAVYQPNHSQADPNEAAVLAYGYAFGNTSYGMVMYEAGHDHDDNHDPIADRVAAQRAFFNFILMAGVQKEISVSSNVPTFVPSGSTISMNASGSGGNEPYVYEWSSSCQGGTFSDPNNASTTYTAPTVTGPTTCFITVKATDNCGRFSFESTAVVVGPLVGPEAIDDIATTPMNTAVDINALANDTEGSGALVPTSVSFVSGTEPNPATEGIFTVHSTTGLVTFTPVNGFTGQVTIYYNVCDINSLCDDAKITVDITNVDGPTAVDDNTTTTLNTPVDIDALHNDTEGAADLDPTTVEFISGSEPPSTEGVFTVDGNTGLVTFTPADGYSGTTEIDYKVCDLNSLCSQATINVFISNGTDTDGDGCDDDVDDYPNDPTRCFNNYYPAAGNGTLAYEDLWPGKGDYDFNDLIIDYRFMTVTNGSNMIVETFGTFIVKAFGATLENGFGFQLANDNIDDADILSVTGYDLQEGYISLGSNGIEQGQAIPTIIVYDNAFNLMPHPGSGIGVNTDPNATYVDPDTLNMYIAYTQSTYSLADLDMPNFNPFLIVDLTRGIEVHLPDYPPTSLADITLFGTMNDDSNPATGKYYKTDNNLPWAINIPEPFDYPIEKSDITSVYLKFVEWAESNGQLSQDWYKDLSGYRNASLIYTHE